MRNFKEFVVSKSIINLDNTIIVESLKSEWNSLIKKNNNLSENYGFEEIKENVDLFIKLFKTEYNDYSFKFKNIEFKVFRNPSGSGLFYVVKIYFIVKNQTVLFKITYSGTNGLGFDFKIGDAYTHSYGRLSEINEEYINKFYRFLKEELIDNTQKIKELEKRASELRLELKNIENQIKELKNI